MPPYFALLENEIFIQKINAGSLNGKILLVHMVLWEPHLLSVYNFTSHVCQNGKKRQCCHV